MNNFLQSALSTAGGIARGASNIAYDAFGGKEFVRAQRRNAKLQQKRGFLGSLADAKYWKNIGLGTAKAGSLAIGGPALKAAVGGLKALGAGARAATQAMRPTTKGGLPLPPSIAKPASELPPPAVRNPFADDVTDPYGVLTRQPSTPYLSPSQAKEAIRAQAQSEIAESQAYRAAQQARAQQTALQAQRAETMRSPFSINPGFLGRATRGTALTGATAAAGVPSRPPVKKVATPVKAPSPTGKNRGGNR